jgi:hypothetical protein
MHVLRRPIEVLASVQFDDKPGFQADEIAYVDANGVLPPELEAVQLPATQVTPKPA